MNNSTFVRSSMLLTLLNTPTKHMSLSHDVLKAQNTHPHLNRSTSWDFAFSNNIKIQIFENKWNIYCKKSLIREPVKINGKTKNKSIELLQLEDRICISTLTHPLFRVLEWNILVKGCANPAVI